MFKSQGGTCPPESPRGGHPPPLPPPLPTPLGTMSVASMRENRWRRGCPHNKGGTVRFIFKAVACGTDIFSVSSITRFPHAAQDASLVMKMENYHQEWKCKLGCVIPGKMEGCNANGANKCSQGISWKKKKKKKSVRDLKAIAGQASAKRKRDLMPRHSDRGPSALPRSHPTHPTTLKNFLTGHSLLLESLTGLYCLRRAWKKNRRTAKKKKLAPAGFDGEALWSRARHFTTKPSSPPYHLQKLFGGSFGWHSLRRAWTKKNLKAELAYGFSWKSEFWRNSQM